MYDIERATSLYQNCSEDPGKSLDMLRRELSSGDALVRHVAAVQLALHHPHAMPPQAVGELLDALEGSSAASQEYGSLAEAYAEATATEDDCHDLQQDIALALMNLPSNPASPAIPVLINLWQKDRQFYEAALAAVTLAFPVGSHRISLTTPAPSQKSVLHALAGDDKIWRYCGDLEPMLADRSLPDSRSAMQAYLQSLESSSYE